MMLVIVGRIATVLIPAHIPKGIIIKKKLLVDEV